MQHNCLPNPIPQPKPHLQTRANVDLHQLYAGTGLGVDLLWQGTFTPVQGEEWHSHHGREEKSPEIAVGHIGNSDHRSLSHLSTVDVVPL